MASDEKGFSPPQNQDLVWDLGTIQQRELAEHFVGLFQNRLCVFSEAVQQLYTNYSLHFPKELGRKMVVLPNPYAFHDTLYGIDPQAISSTRLCILAGTPDNPLGTLKFARLDDSGQPVSKVVPLRLALRRMLERHEQTGTGMLPVLMKGDLREFGHELPYLHLHQIEVQRLLALSMFERQDIQHTIVNKLAQLCRELDQTD